jgi:demethylmenaquinone methyltransferase/2-methoxy-6-polyprenyl-1,4-benzoquinol methylase
VPTPSPTKCGSRRCSKGGGGGTFGAAARRDRGRALAELSRLGALGHVLELAAGTESYTPALLESAEHVTAVDASSESLALARTKLVGFADRLTFVEANIFSWRPTQRYSTVFFSYWLSHVPTHLFDSFWQLVADALAPNGRVFLIDSGGTAKSGTRIWASGYRELDDPHCEVSTRELNGREYRVVKASYMPTELECHLSEIGWQARLVQGEFSWWGTVRRRPVAIQ